MNTNPDETKLALWMDDELTGPDFDKMEAWASNQPEQLKAREELRKFRATISEHLPASEAPPYPDFFNSRVIQGIRDLQAAEAKPVRSVGSQFWKSWLMPIAACAGMVVAFGVGRHGGSDSNPIADRTPAPFVSPVVYTPEEGVDAEWYASEGSDATVIVLAGVSAIPDATDFSQTVYVPTINESDRTATHESEETGPTKQ